MNTTTSTTTTNLMNVITRAHGTGGASTHRLIEETFFPFLKTDALSANDAAILPMDRSGTAANWIITTDAHVVQPIIFPGGDIGKLCVTGVVNDLLTQGGRPRYLSLSFILEEGLALDKLKKILKSLKTALQENQIQVVCADTKVIPTSAANSATTSAAVSETAQLQLQPSQQPGLLITSTLIGESLNPHFKPMGAQVGDDLILTGRVGAHGLALLQAREGLPFQTQIESDCASLFPLLSPLILSNEQHSSLHALRDVTRGGLGGILHEWARQFKVSFEINQADIPIAQEVQSGLQFLGIDPLEVANEGLMLMAVDARQSESVLQHLRSHPLGKFAQRIGRVCNSEVLAPVVLKTKIGGRRLVPWPEALNLPRIC